MNELPILAYSYLRFSSDQQADGDSIRRQTDLRDVWLAKSGVTLDTSLRLRDEGKSAFTGEHRKNPDRHALAAFLRLVENGRIAKGSYLIVENLDRLSREHIQPALILFLNLLQAGIRVVQLLPVEQVYDSNSETMAIMMAIMELSRGNSESRMKSERIGRAWSELKRKAAIEKKPITPMVPAWLKVVGEKEKRRIVVIPERGKVVKQIFKLAIDGYGLIAIAEKLTSSNVPTFGKSVRWNPSSIHKILHFRAVVGEYQPRRNKKRVLDGNPIQGFFPTIISDAQWHVAQAALKSRHEGGRRLARQYNPFAGLLFDARDGNKIYVTGPSARANTTLVNCGSISGDPNAKYVSFPLVPFVRAILSQLRELNISDVLDQKEDLGELVELAGKRADLESRIAAVQDALESGDQDVKAAINSLRNLETKLQDVIAAESAERARSALPTATAFRDLQTVIESVSIINDDHTNDDIRARLRAVLRRVIDRVICLFVARGHSRLAAVQVWFKDSDRRRGYLIGHTQGHFNKPARWWVRSFRELKFERYDLLKQAHVDAVEKILSRIDPNTYAAQNEVNP